MKNTPNTIAEMKDMNLTNWFSSREYKQMSNDHNWVKLETLKKNNVLEVREVCNIVETLSPEEMASFANSCAGEDCWGDKWHFRWNAKKMHFESLRWETLYRVK